MCESKKTKEIPVSFLKLLHEKTEVPVPEIYCRMEDLTREYWSAQRFYNYFKGGRGLKLQYCEPMRIAMKLSEATFYNILSKYCKSIFAYKRKRVNARKENVRD